jgi:hypothetical protein
MQPRWTPDFTNNSNIALHINHLQGFLFPTILEAHFLPGISKLYAGKELLFPDFESYPHQNVIVNTVS